MAGGVALPLGRKFIVGATFGRVYNSNTLDAPYIFQTNPILKGFKTALDLHTAGYGWDGSFGVLARPVRTVQFGAVTNQQIVSAARVTRPETRAINFPHWASLSRPLFITKPE